MIQFRPRFATGTEPLDGNWPLPPHPPPTRGPARARRKAPRVRHHRSSEPHPCQPPTARRRSAESQIRREGAVVKTLQPPPAAAMCVRGRLAKTDSSLAPTGKSSAPWTSTVSSPCPVANESPWCQTRAWGFPALSKTRQFRQSLEIFIVSATPPPYTHTHTRGRPRKKARAGLRLVGSLP